MTDLSTICNNCTYFRMTSDGDIVCCRYPKAVNVDHGYWCGEWRHFQPAHYVRELHKRLIDLETDLELKEEELKNANPR